MNIVTLRRLFYEQKTLNPCGIYIYFLNHFSVREETSDVYESTFERDALLNSNYKIVEPNLAEKQKNVRLN